ncbi:hypothetical protein SAMN04487965_2225 [Microbulbifer donghaiensis]|uniref:Sulfotransferase family protein n=1 Tax=Microbulbifer donghaiensis TaxID=494016 RepID=A0A1M5CKC9_9GAMM|nr:sulfotransferase [Microbulbifer donghaiensis]SHF55168.1 hypothetical protein SAMN04487965_2225 [Microbulbifer donghaiensis]
MITPIMLRSFGRSGSTLLMQVLGSSKNVIFDRDYPFEKRHLTYFHRLANIVGKDADNDSDWNPDTIFNSSLNRVGPIPYQEVEIFDRKKLSDDLLRRLWNGFSHQVAACQSESIDDSKPIYYAEKVVHDICDDINNIVEAKNLFLFRDPRDEFLSVKSFNKKRGFNGFGWQKDDTDESYALKLCNMRRNFMRHIANIERDERRFLVKYEEFMGNPYEITNSIGEWIGLNLDYGKVESQKKAVAHHFTSSSVGASVGRWKTEMEQSVAAIFARELGEELQLLGYEV